LTETSRKNSLAQELAAASGVPLAFRKKFKPRCIFPHSRQSTSAGGFPPELRCGELRCVAQQIPYVMMEITRHKV